MPPAPARRAIPGLVLLLLGAACAGEPPPPPLSATTTTLRGAAAPAAGTPAPESGPVTRYDGRYVGTMTLNPDRTRRCQPAPPGEMSITVRQGRGTFQVDPTTRQTLSGSVGRDGQARFSDIVDRTIATSGVFTTEGFIGEHRNGLCSYAVNMRRLGGA